MCGIAGFWNRNADSAPDALAALAGRMAACLSHRGPDAGGVWTKPEWGVALAHRRLSIVDLSPAGAQPMVSHSGRYVIIFNGEIYNFRELRAALSREWRGHSDTEVILALLDEYGLEGALQKLNGMFAFAVLDQNTKQLYLARDRFGEKPLYYGWSDNYFLFASELKSITAHPAFDGAIDRNALGQFFKYNCIGQEQSIYQSVRKLMPGYFLTLDLATGGQGITQYWSAQNEIAQARAMPLGLSFAEAVDALDGKLQAIVQQRMVADVPLGSFLSGGVDSSLVTALMQQGSAQPVKTFSIGFDNDRYDEAPHARQIAQHLGTDHTEFYVTSQDARNVIMELPSIYDEPFADSSAIPTLLLSRLARQHVTVALTGDGGDEIFGGYNRYRHAPRLWQKLSKLPPALRPVLGHIMQTISPQQWHKILPKKYNSIGDKIQKLAHAVDAADPQGLYRNLLTHWHDGIVIGADDDRRINWHDDLNFTENMIAHDLTHYLPDDILTKVDRAAMNASLETRVPFLDPALLSFVWQLPLSYRVQGNDGKIILKALLDRYVPRALIDRPKMGFAVPIDHWLRHELRDWAEDLLDETKLRQQGYLNPAPIRQKWQEHLSGRRNWQHHLWDVLMFQAWVGR